MIKCTLVFQARRCRYEGGAFLIAGIVLLVVVALVLSAMGYLYVSGTRGGTLHGSSARAYFAARSGIEVATRQYSTGTACAALASGAQAVGTNESFSVAPTLYDVSPPTANNTTLTSAQTFIPIATGAISSYAPSGRVRIETEEIDYSEVSSDGTACGGSPPCLIVSKRGAAGTTAAAHAAKPVYENLCHIRSTGTSGAATRYVDRTFHDPATLMVYAKIGSGVANADYPRPFYRFWTGSAWGAEQVANNFGLSGVGSTIRWTVLRMARTRNEAILATVHDDGSIRLQIWDGFRWFIPGVLGAGGQLATGLGGEDAYRGVYIAYETENDRAVIVYNNNTRNPAYRIWDGSTLTAAASITGGAGGNYPSAGATARPRWVRLASNPLATSNEIAMITLDNNRDVTGVRWNGSTWASLEAGVASLWENNASNTAAAEAIALEYENNSGRAMFMWAQPDPGGGGNRGPMAYRIWNGASPPIGGVSTFTIAAMPNNSSGQWLRLVAQRESNNLLFGVQDSGSDLNTRYWNGSGWDTATQHPEHDGSVEQTTNRVFDLVFETHPTQTGDAWIVWANGTQVSAKKFSAPPCGGSCWGGTTNRGDDTSRIDAEANPGTGDVFSLSYESSSANNPQELLEMHLTGGAGAWSGTTPIWARNDTNPATDGRQHLVSRQAIEIFTEEYIP